MKTSLKFVSRVRLLAAQIFPEGIDVEMIRTFSRAFTLIELVFVLLILSLIALVGFRTLGSQLDQERSRQTIQELDAILKAILGEEAAVAGGKRVDFGYWGDEAGWPDTTSSNAFAADLRPYLNIVTTADVAIDAWGNPYVFVNDGSVFTVRSRGADNADGGSDTGVDISFSIRKDMWEQNSIVIYVQDNRGTLLVPAISGGDLDKGHIMQVSFTEHGGAAYAWSSVSATLTRQNNGFYLNNTVLAGPCSVTVSVADNTTGPPFGGTYDWRPELTGGEADVSENFVVYPKAGTSLYNVFIVKLPGAALRGFNDPGL